MNMTTNTHVSIRFRHKLLATVSAATLLAMTCSAEAAASASSDRPVLWIEAGAQFNRISGQSEFYVPPFSAVAESFGLIPVEIMQSLPRWTIGEEGKITFQPADSDWIFSASIQYGRSASNKHRHQEIYVPPFVDANGFVIKAPGPNPNAANERTADYAVKVGERHDILDFQVGKDVGLGISPDSVSSELALGVRIAQLTSNTRMNLHADPDPHFGDYKYLAPFFPYRPWGWYYQFYKARPEISRKFHGVGPSLAWSGSVLAAGSNSGDAAITFDWGVNASILFGKQNVKIHHHTAGDRYENDLLNMFRSEPRYVDDHYLNTATTTRVRSVVVPNIGGLVGISLKFPNAKLSLGYRADFFFNATDGGIDAAKKEDRGFYGPYASISIGIGD